MQPYKLLLFFLLTPFALSAQPQPCVDPPTMTSVCADACIICDIDGFTGRHEAEEVGESPPGFAGECTFVAHNMQWIAFIAGSEDLQVRMSVSNCTLGNGLEFGLYKGINCENYERISNCFGGAAGIISPGTSGIIRNTEPLTIGQYYYIVMDGGLKDNCDWTFEVVSGDTKVSPLNTSGDLVGAFDVCPNVEQLYTLNAPVGATEFNWELNNRLLDFNSADILLAFDAPGVYNLCVTAFNACEEAPPTCQSILVTAIPPTDLGKQQICEGDNFEVADTVLNTTGLYRFPLKTADGCDSLVLVDLEAIPASFTDLGSFNICEEDALPIGDEVFSITGIHTKVLANFLGCDSTVTLDLFVVICNIQGSIDATPARCFGEASGTLNFSVLNGTPPFNYSYERVGRTTTGDGTINQLGEVITLSGLIAGTYLITINDNFGNQRILIGQVMEPDLLAADWRRSDYNGFPISCFGTEDGTLEVLPIGGTAPYSYTWNNGSVEARQRAIPAGNYTLTLSDANGCSLIVSNELTAPSNINLVANFIDPTCDGQSTGRIEISNITGGTAPYLFDLNGQGFSGRTTYTDLTEGAYEIVTQDANGCESTQEGALVAPIIPVIDLGEDRTVELADAVPLSLNSLTELETITWRNDFGLSCYDCPKTTASPTNRMIYSVTVSSIDGCTVTDSLAITVLKVRDIYAPTAFSPNKDGLNDLFFLYGGPEVRSINYFRIFSRWGEQIFEQQNFAPNDAANGWNGEIKGRLPATGVFIWMAEISFIDGETLIYSGDVAVVR